MSRAENAISTVRRLLRTYEDRARSAPSMETRLVWAQVADDLRAELQATDRGCSTPSSRQEVEALARVIRTQIAPHGGWDSLVAAAEAVLDAGYRLPLGTYLQSTADHIEAALPLAAQHLRDVAASIEADPAACDCDHQPDAPTREGVLSEDEREAIHENHATPINLTHVGCPLCYGEIKTVERIVAAREAAALREARDALYRGEGPDMVADSDIVYGEWLGNRADRIEGAR